MQVVPDEMCTFCKEYKESVKHLFWECSIVAEFWQHLRNEAQEFMPDELEWHKVWLNYIYEDVRHLSNLII